MRSNALNATNLQSRRQQLHCPPAAVRTWLCRQSQERTVRNALQLRSRGIQVIIDKQIVKEPMLVEAAACNASVMQAVV